MQKFWLIKSEAGCYSIDDLKRDKRTPWTGIRNYQARNFMRDDMQLGDLCLFYHSSATPSAIAGIAKVASEPHLDETAFDSKDEHYDPKLSKNKATVKLTDKSAWVCVDIAFVKKLSRLIELPEIKNDPKLASMLVTKQGSRLSIQPVSKAHFEYITNTLAGS